VRRKVRPADIPEELKTPDECYSAMAELIRLCEPWLDYVATPPPERDLDADVDYFMRRWNQVRAFLDGPGKKLTQQMMYNRRVEYELYDRRYFGVTRLRRGRTEVDWVYDPFTGKWDKLHPFTYSHN